MYFLPTDRLQCAASRVGTIISHAMSIIWIILI
nr:MAG TPA: hypothetical protein [Caudoviricetes sp.]